MPSGEPLYKIARDVLQAVGRQKLREFMPYLRAKELDPMPILDGALTMGARFIPYINSYIDEGGRVALAELDQQDASDWLVRSPHTIDAAKTAILDLCQETVETFGVDTIEQIEAVKQEIRNAVAGSIEAGETQGQMVDRVARWIDDNARWRARRIAVTESARAYNQGQHAATDSLDFVAGYKLLLSDDACPICHAIKRQCPVIRKGGTFGTNGKNDTYKDLKFPPFHPGCRCTTVVVFDDEVPKEWPKPVTPGPGGYIQPTDADFAAAEAGGYESVAIGNAKSWQCLVLMDE